MKLWPLDLEKYHELSVFRNFFFHAFRYSFDIWQIKFEFGFDPLTFLNVMALVLRNILRIISFQQVFFLRVFRYSFDIWYNALLYQDTDQVRVWFQSIDFERSYGPWT
jgi:hypothetical protein